MPSPRWASPCSWICRRSLWSEVRVRARVRCWRISLASKYRRRWWSQAGKEPQYQYAYFEAIGWVEDKYIYIYIDPNFHTHSPLQSDIWPSVRKKHQTNKFVEKTIKWDSTPLLITTNIVLMFFFKSNILLNICYRSLYCVYFFYFIHLFLIHHPLSSLARPHTPAIGG